MSTTGSDGPFGATGYGTRPAHSGGSTSPSSTGGSADETTGSSGAGDFASNGAGGYYGGSNGSPYSSSTAGTGSSSGYSSSAYSSTGSTTPISTPGPTSPGSTSGAPDTGSTELSRGAVTTRTAPTQRVNPNAAGAHAAQNSRTASTAATRKHRGPRRVRLAVARVDPWSVMKMSFLLSVALGIAGVVLTAVLWMILSTMNVFTDVESVLQSLQTTTSDPFSIKDYVGFGRVVSLSIVIGVIDIILLTAIATVMAFLYNICSALVGGVQLTLTDD